MNIDILLGKTTEHLVPLEGTKCFIHKEMHKDFYRLKNKAESEGFHLGVVSAFRSFEAQLRIWNLKAQGERTLLDDQEKPLEFAKLTPHEIVMSILRWSAVPGASRHHWGTDIDVFDAGTQALDEVMLIPSETVSGGPAARLHEWLDSLISSGESFGFYRPYSEDLGGVSPERWHLSYSPLSQRYFESYTPSIFKKNIEDSEVHLKETLLSNAEEIYQRFFLNINFP